MQMSNFRVRGKLSMTYEPALARIFKDGRTETIRSCTPAAAAFIHEMSSENVDKGQFEIQIRRPIPYDCNLLFKLFKRNSWLI